MAYPGSRALQPGDRERMAAAGHLERLLTARSRHPPLADEASAGRRGAASSATMRFTLTSRIRRICRTSSAGSVPTHWPTSGIWPRTASSGSSPRREGGSTGPTLCCRSRYPHRRGHHHHSAARWLLTSLMASAKLNSATRCHSTVSSKTTGRTRVIVAAGAAAGISGNQRYPAELIYDNLR